MKIDKTKTSSIRKAFGKTLVEVGELNEKIVVMDADLACSTQTQMFANKYPDRFFDCGIAEQDMVATAAGLASEGKILFVASFAMFATGRTYDQIRNAVCYPNFNVKIVGTHGGVTVGEDGATHQALEDISLMRGLPNMTVIVPADCNECTQAIDFAAEYDGPVYIRIARNNLPDIYPFSVRN
jgi:transketolase